MRFLLAPFHFDKLSYPWVLFLLAGVLLLLFLELRARAAGAIAISTGDSLARIVRGRVYPLRRVPPLLRAIGLALLIVALAGPMNGYQRRPDRADVIDIMLVLDVSGSMQTPDYIVNGRQFSRMDVAKSAVHDFIESRKVNTADRFGLDRVGLVLFCGVPWTQCPLTLDYDVLDHEIELTDFNRDQNKDGTAIGSGIGLAVRRLTQSEAKSKVIVLLTDGNNNRGELDPITAAKAAKDLGVKVYTIGAGSKEGMAGGGLFGAMMARDNGIDEDTMKSIAETTGGRYYRAADVDALHAAYAEIDKLERTEINLGEFYEYKEAFMPWVFTGALALLAGSVVRRRWCEAIP